jgi:hypothetical protein
LSNQLFDQENYEVATAIAEVDESKRVPLVPASSDPMAIIALAVQHGAEPAQLRELLELQREYAKDRAAERFGEALTQFQRRCRFVEKVREATIYSDKGNYKYNFASFDDVMRVAAPALDECSLAVSFSTEAIDKGIRCTCRIRHGIHFEDHTIDVPVPQMKVNDTQKYGAALSYAKRYALCAALNIVVTDDIDNDAATLIDPISQEQEIQLRELIEAKGADLPKFLAWMGVEKLSDIAVVDFQKAVTALRNKR